MSDIQTMKELITGLKQKKKNLEADEKVFLKLSGINEEIEKASQDKAGYDEELTSAKKIRDDAKKKKSDAVAKTTFKIAAKMNAVLPSGKAVFTYTEDDAGKRDLKIGWSVSVKTLCVGFEDKYSVDNVVTPYNGLSGGQLKTFEAALAVVLDANIIVVEAAELDSDNLLATLKELSKLNKQVIVNTCHELPVEIGLIDGFEIIEV